MQSLQLDKEMNPVTELKMQGTLVVNLPFLDYLLSQDIFKNVLFPDKLISFLYKMRHNVLSCNFTLSKWYGTDPRCKIDGYHIESMAARNSRKTTRSGITKFAKSFASS